ncbi:NifU family protein [Paractinoplanes atraurantiacus]|uniref:Fe-S cluster biogenesis protein NfuA, 4Fe-4S-binding domain n=1 Tax=Paractinoplanes atraurantiacus TaxID=1036182 RepID=A0A285J3D4_9ACTN|nr:NifU family protein [Actinoplanes atraurantiacus]SNY54835.1 hypothetical protein SAMN05421748_115169 [Actinoplanes atraurantiacus]
MTTPDAAAARVEVLIEQLRAGPDPRSALVADELVRCLVQLYGEGLRRVVERLGPEGATALCDDPLVESLLLVHDLHPAGPRERITRALERLRPRVGELDLLGIGDDGVVRLRAAGSRGCGSAQRSLIESAVRRVAPEAVRVEVETPPPLLQVTRRPG